MLLRRRTRRGFDFRAAWHITVEVADGLATSQNVTSGFSNQKRDNNASLCGLGDSVGNCNLLLSAVALGWLRCYQYFQSERH